MPAATDFHVNGPTTVRWGLNAGTLVDLGFTDNDDLVRIAVTDHKRIFTRNDSGDMIAEVVYSGSTAVIDVTFVSINEDELNELVSKARTGTGATTIANQGVFATVGGVTIGNANPANGVRIFALEIEPTNSGETKFTFPRVMLTSGPEYMDLGNAVKRIAMSFTTVAPASGTAFMTTAAV